MVAMAETLEGRVRLARSAADLVVNPMRYDLFDLGMDHTGGRGFDVVILASRDVPVDSDLFSLLAPGGRVSLFSGLPPDLASGWLDLNRLHYREHMVVGSYGCTPAQNRGALELISGGLDVRRLITERVSLREMRRGMEHAGERRGLKAVVNDFGW